MCGDAAVGGSDAIDEWLDAVGREGASWVRPRACLGSPRVWRCERYRTNALDVTVTARGLALSSEVEVIAGADAALGPTVSGVPAGTATRGSARLGPTVRVIMPVSMTAIVAN